MNVSSAWQELADPAAQTENEQDQADNKEDQIRHEPDACEGNAQRPINGQAPFADQIAPLQSRAHQKQDPKYDGQAPPSQEPLLRLAAQRGSCNMNRETARKQTSRKEDRDPEPGPIKHLAGIRLALA